MRWLRFLIDRKRTQEAEIELLAMSRRDREGRFEPQPPN